MITRISLQPGMDGLSKRVHDELVRIELEEELSSMTSTPWDEQRCAKSVLHTSPIMSQESNSSDDNRIMHNDNVVRSLDFTAPATDVTPLHKLGSAQVAVDGASANSALVEHIFTLDADF